LRSNEGKIVWDLVRKDIDSELLVEYLTNILSYGISGENFDTESKWDENESESKAPPRVRMSGVRLSRMRLPRLRLPRASRPRVILLIVILKNLRNLLQQEFFVSSLVAQTGRC